LVVNVVFGTSTTVFNTVNSNTMSIWYTGTLTLVSGQVAPLTQYTMCFLMSGPSDPTTTLLAMVLFPTLVKVY
jgi:hypothetical protein